MGAVPTGAVPVGADDVGTVEEELAERVGTLEEGIELGRTLPLGRGTVELQYWWSQLSNLAASVPFLHVSAMQWLTTGPLGGPQSEPGVVTFSLVQQLVQHVGICGYGAPVPLGGKGGRAPVPAGAVPSGTDGETETGNDGVALVDGTAIPEPVPTGMLNEMDALLPVGIGLRQKSLSHQE